MTRLHRVGPGRAPSAARAVLRALAAGGALFVAAACGGGKGESPSAQAPGTIRVARAGDETYVTIDQTDQGPVNPACTSYCDRVAACWSERPNNPDLMATRGEVVTRCRREQADCRTPTTDMHCCAAISDCYDFNRCAAGARDVEMSCDRARGAVQ